MVGYPFKLWNDIYHFACMRNSIHLFILEMIHGGQIAVEILILL